MPPTATTVPPTQPVSLCDIAIQSASSGTGDYAGYELVYAIPGVPVDAGSGSQVIVGAEGNDVIDAGSGSDIIDGGSGADQIDDGSGSDTII